jgi:DNA (cytosine-5)-methyltransferase 1
MKSGNPHSGIYEADTSRTLDENGGNPSANQGGIAILEGNGSRESHRGEGYAVSDTMFTLNTVERHAVCESSGGSKGADIYNGTITGEIACSITSGGTTGTGPKLLQSG